MSLLISFEGNFVPVAREDFAVGEKLSLRLLRLRRVFSLSNNHVYQIEDLRYGAVEDVHGLWSKF